MVNWFEQIIQSNFFNIFIPQLYNKTANPDSGNQLQFITEDDVQQQTIYLKLFSLLSFTNTFYEFNLPSKYNIIIL